MVGRALVGRQFRIAHDIRPLDAEAGERVEVRRLRDGDRHAGLQRENAGERPAARRPHSGRHQDVRDVARRVVALERSIEAVRRLEVRHRRSQNRRVEHRRGVVLQHRSRVAYEIRQPVRHALLHSRRDAVINRRPDVVAIEAHRRVLGERLEQLSHRNGGIPERRRARDDAEVRIGDARRQRRTERQLIGGQLVEICVGDADVRDLRADVRDLD